MPSTYYYQAQGRVLGPLSPSQLKRHARRGRLTGDTPVRKGEGDDWVPAGRFPSLFDRAAESPARGDDGSGRFRVGQAEMPVLFPPEGPPRHEAPAGRAKRPRKRARPATGPLPEPAPEMLPTRAHLLPVLSVFGVELKGRHWLLLACCCAAAVALAYVVAARTRVEEARITPEAYEKIRLGMSPEEAETILGGGAKEAGVDMARADPEQGYEWRATHWLEWRAGDRAILLGVKSKTQGVFGTVEYRQWRDGDATRYEAVASGARKPGMDALSDPRFAGRTPWFHILGRRDGSGGSEHVTVGLSFSPPYDWGKEGVEVETLSETDRTFARPAP